MRTLVLLASAVLAACGSDGVVRPPQVRVHFIDTAANYGPIAIARERVTAAQLQYGGGIRTSFDSGNYDFHLSYTLNGFNSPVQTLSKAYTLVPGNSYAFIVTAPADVADMLIVPVSAANVGDSIARISITHAKPDAGALDVYVAAAGSDLSTLTPNATISYGPAAETFDVTPGSPHLYLTPANDPATIVFESNNLDALGGEHLKFAVAETGGIGFADYTVFDYTDLVKRTARVDVGAELRVVHGIDDRMDRDILLDSGPAPFVSPLVFGELSPDLPVALGNHTLSVTPVGAPGTEESTAGFAPLQGRNYMAVVAGDTTDGINMLVQVEDRRRLLGQGTMTVVNAAGLFDAVMFFLKPPGTDPVNSVPTLGPIFPPTFASQLGIAPGDYEITVLDATTLAVLAGPEPITIEDRGLYGILLSNSDTASTIDISYFYDLGP